MERHEFRELSEAIKAQLDYRAFYARYCHKARGHGARLRALCPIPGHKHSGLGQHSLSLDCRRGLWHCFSRDEGGDAITFYELMHGVSFARAVRELAHEVGLNGHASRPPEESARTLRPAAWEDTETLQPERLAAICEKFLAACLATRQSEGQHYLAQRGIDEATRLRAGIAYFPRREYPQLLHHLRNSFELPELQRSGLFNEEGRLTFYSHRLLFPFYVEGRALYLQGRATTASVAPRWHNMRGRVPALYGIDTLRALPSEEIVYLVEGFTDTLTLWAHGFHAVGIVGAGGFRESWLPALARFQMVAALDGDTAGARAAARYRKMFAKRGLLLPGMPLATDVNDFFRARPTAALEWALLTEAACERTEQL